ncbi:hypothetical protein [Cytobacillus firmus]|uniref:hypothetical protein n=1 Tax=Cytobacillus firmus TaxID=1399 RepID=UPI003083FF00
MSAGMDEIPLLTCKEKGILITNARGIQKIPMAEFALGIMLGHVKQKALLFLKMNLCLQGILSGAWRM